MKDEVNDRKRCIGCEKCVWHWNARLHCKQAIFSLLSPFLALYTCSYSHKMHIAFPTQPCNVKSVPRLIF
jgi:hypothetical protein